ncbi:hypothetical protein [Noviherbaspirillum sp.]|uniref:hypothetical protein n=1 Tax=Noviherbaspirillum sp. TaxID=1926288 RepID=UPI002B465F00|nr:hypothetical protein [Noviherbaspirillum sp.]
MKGLTIIQLMLLLFIAGIAATVLIDFLVGMRCEGNPTLKLCVDRKESRTR